MRDLVETIIGQVMQQKPTIKSYVGDDTTPPTSKPAARPHIMKPLEIKDQEMWQACCQFEAIFLQQMMAAMRKTVPESTLMPKSYATDMYNGMMDQAIAESGSKHAPLGLAMNMYRQLERDGFAHTEHPEKTPDAQAVQHIADRLKTVGQTDKPKLGGLNGAY